MSPLLDTMCAVDGSTSCLQTVASAKSFISGSSSSASSYSSRNSFSMSKWLDVVAISPSALAVPIAIGSSLAVPAANVWTQVSAAFAFLSPAMPASVLCSTCAAKILGTWAAWTTSVPYAAGSSPTIASLPALWKAIYASCGLTSKAPFQAPPVILSVLVAPVLYLVACIA